MKPRSLLPVCVLVVAVLAMALAGTATAKSLYMATQNGRFASYNLSGNTLTWQAEGNSSGGDVGVAVDSDNEVLFITTEGRGYMKIFDPTNFAVLGTVTAPGARNLAGIVYDHDKSLLYLVDRGSNKLYVYSWNASTYTLTPVTGSPFYPTGLSNTYGIALDEINDLLYVANRSTTIRIYNTALSSSCRCIWFFGFDGRFGLAAVRHIQLIRCCGLTTDICLNIPAAIFRISRNNIERHLEVAP